MQADGGEGLGLVRSLGLLAGEGLELDFANNLNGLIQIICHPISNKNIQTKF